MVKIHGSGQTNFNPYKNRLQKQMNDSKGTGKKDQLEISDEAKKLHNSEKTDAKRASYVQKMKDAVDKGTYQIDYEKTARRMMDFWSTNTKGGD
ncbi:flagellar biosynthesis anti-sigma factor FlgM [Lentibacillus cibarius]|uniref:flagellar biosynthesis anti-sigma factor FlgM n=1 Tax=Lentibacillus cibarius TaxID=2583219 RepID=UPI0015F2AFA8|nr:flagellar biosynthesis anti-sigma factor FlgM [Lentibacillus cibarius]